MVFIKKSLQKNKTIKKYKILTNIEGSLISGGGGSEGGSGSGEK